MKPEIGMAYKTKIQRLEARALSAIIKKSIGAEDFSSSSRYTQSAFGLKPVQSRTCSI